jgi:carboxylesterase type B
MSPANTAFSEELIAYWLSFVRSGDPNTFKQKRSPVWAPFNSKKSRIVLQEGPAALTIVSGSFLEQESGIETRRCKLIASQAGVQQN